MQLGKLREQIGRFRESGAEVFAVSNDDRESAARMTSELNGEIRVVSDATMRLIYRYGMKGHQMPMAAMGYVVIDQAGIVRARKIERFFGQRADEIVKVLRDSATVAIGDSGR